MMHALMGYSFDNDTPLLKKSLSILPLEIQLASQGVVAAMCPVLPSATAIKVKSKGQAHTRAAIKGSRWWLGYKLYDQNQNKIRDCNCVRCHNLTVNCRATVVVLLYFVL